MAYSARAYKVMIASPSDVAKERQIIRDVLLEWNSVHSEDKRIVLMPVGWETHAAPVMGARAQEVINGQVLAGCDLLVAAFWTRIGTPTGGSASGTVEEIEKHIAEKKPAMVYFSSAPVHLDSVEQEQYGALREFKERCKERGLIECYESLTDFREKFSRHLAATVIRNWGGATSVTSTDLSSAAVSVSPARDLSDAARELLTEASRGDGTIVQIGALNGLVIEAGERQFVETGDPRSEALWESAVEELVRGGLIQDKVGKGEVFFVTNSGFHLADSLGGV